MRAKYDIIIVGGSSAGSYFARKMARRGFGVLIIEKDARDDISRGYDIFHMIEHERCRFDLPEIRPGDGVYAFEYNESYTFSPYGKYPKFSNQTVTGMHRHEYMLKMLEAAEAAGAEVLYEAEFIGHVISDGRLCGVRFIHNGETRVCACRLAVDCSGQNAVLRRSLPDDYGVETRPLSEKELFFVKLRYIRFDEPPKEKWLKSFFYMYYKAWLSPAGDDADAILGVGVSLGYKYADEALAQLIKNVRLPAFHVVREEHGTTPYTRPIYSFVGDGFIALGDAAAVTKANNGEGCIAQLPLADIAAEVAVKALREDGVPTRESLWPINRRYYEGQGKEQALMLAALAHALNHSIETNEYLFKKNTLFNDKILSEGPDPAPLTPVDILKMLVHLAIGRATGKIKSGEIGEIIGGGLRGVRIMLHYSRYPETPRGFEKWTEKADRLWEKAGSMAECFESRIKEENSQ